MQTLSRTHPHCLPPELSHPPPETLPLQTLTPAPGAQPRLPVSVTPTPPGTSQQGTRPAGPLCLLASGQCPPHYSVGVSLLSGCGAATTRTCPALVHPASPPSYQIAPWIPARVGFSDRVRDSGAELQFSPAQRGHCIRKQVTEGRESWPCQALWTPALCQLIPCCPGQHPGQPTSPAAGAGFMEPCPPPKLRVIHRGPARLPPPHLAASLSVHQVPPGLGVSQRWPLQGVG